MKDMHNVKLSKNFRLGSPILYSVPKVSVWFNRRWSNFLRVNECDNKRMFVCVLPSSIKHDVLSSETDDSVY